MKKSAAVLAAEQLASDKAAELAAAKDAVRRLEQEWAEAHKDVRKQQENDDAALTQCRMVNVHRYSGKDADAGRVVILCRTPGGMLVVRRVGDTSGLEYKFKFVKYAERYIQAGKHYSYSDRRELRDVPAEYMPVTSKEL